MRILRTNGRLGLVLLTLVLACSSLAASQPARTAVEPAAEPVAPVVVFFYQEGCPDCIEIAGVLDALAGDFPEGAVARYEIGDPASRKLFRKMLAAYSIDGTSVPIVFVGERVIAGASRIQELALTDALGDCVTSSCPSPFDRLPPDVFPWGDLLELALLASLVLLLALLQVP